MEEKTYVLAHPGEEIDEADEKSLAMADYVVERGTSEGNIVEVPDNNGTPRTIGTGTWYYEKWNSGFLVLRGYFPITNYPVNSAWGGVYETDPSFYITFPSVVTSIISNHITHTGKAGWLELGGGMSNTRTSLIWLVCGAASSDPVSFAPMITAFGRWK